MESKGSGASEQHRSSAPHILALSGRLRKRLNQNRGNEVPLDDAQYLANALNRAPAIGETSVRLLLSMLDHAELGGPEL